MLFFIIPYVTLKLFTLFSIWFSIIHISYTIYLLINSFLILDKLLLILYWFFLSLYLFSFAAFAWSCCFNSSITILIYFFFMLYFLSSSSYYSLFISPLLWHSNMFICFLASFIVLYNPSFPPELQFFLFLLPQALTPIFFLYRLQLLLSRF